MIQREICLNQLIHKMHNHMIKIITGVLRCGKSVLLNEIFYHYLLNQGVDDSHIIKFAFYSPVDLDKLCLANKYGGKVDSNLFSSYILSRIIDDGQYYLLLDEIQLLEDFESVLCGLLNNDNIDIYVTGSSSIPSSDLITKFKGCGDEARLYPLSFKEFYSYRGGEKIEAYKDYCLFGGMPALIDFRSDKQKAQYLSHLMDVVYLNDIVIRNKVRYQDELDSIIDFLCSNIGFLTNPKKIHNTIKSCQGRSPSELTIKKISFLFKRCFSF